MKKYAPILLLLFSSVLNGQENASEIGVIGGITQDGFGGLLNYNLHISNKGVVQFGIYGSLSKLSEPEGEIPFDVFTFHTGYFYNIFQADREKITVSGGLGVVGGYELINRGKENLSNGALVNDQSKFIYGGYASLEFGFLLNRSLSLVIKGNQFYHANSDLGTLVPFGGLGLRYYIY